MVEHSPIVNKFTFICLSKRIGLVIRKLNVGPIVVQVRTESHVGMSILRNWPSLFRSWILVVVNEGPIVVQMRRESWIWMSISWHRSANIWGRILLVFLMMLALLVKLQIGPVIVKMGAKCAVRVSIFRKWTSDVRLWILPSGKLDKGGLSRMTCVVFVLWLIESSGLRCVLNGFSESCFGFIIYWCIESSGVSFVFSWSTESCLSYVLLIFRFIECCNMSLVLYWCIECSSVSFVFRGRIESGRMCLIL